jgi:hypothetical protein
VVQARVSRGEAVEGTLTARRLVARARGGEDDHADDAGEDSADDPGDDA